MTSRDQQICAKILAEIAMIRELMGAMTEQDFLDDERTSRAVCMTLITIGELVKNITDDLTNAHRDIPWRAVAGMRDVTAHKYHTLRKEDVYHTCVEDIPVFEQQLKALTTA